MEKTYDDLIRENQALRDKIETAKNPILDSRAQKLMNAIQGIRQKGRVETNTLKVRTWADHKNISLWHADGRRVGPLHPDNAERTLRRFFDLGIMLSSEEPTKEQVEAYKQTDEYKEYRRKCDEKDILRERSRKGNEAEKIAKEIARELGKPVAEINKLIQSMPLSMGRQMSGVKAAPQHIDPEMKLKK